MPGTVHPKTGPRQGQSHAEARLYEALQSELPDDWTAWHSLRLRDGAQWEGEGDFVVAAPNLGILVVEVKGGQIELRNGRWSQNGKPMKRAPREQAQSFARHLVEAVADRGGEPPPWGIACCFPDVPFSDDAAPASGDLKGLVIGRRQLAWLGEALPALYERAVPKRRVPPISKWAPKLHELWGETWVPKLGLGDRIRDAEEHHLRLNKEQLGVLAIAGSSPRAVVAGGAGSGKTVLARELCLRRAQEGKRALYLCYTDGLGLALDRELEAAERLGDASDRPDITVVDEGQDLSTEDWLLVDALSRDRELWVFHDTAQDYWTERTIPPSIADGAARLTLPEQMRNPPSVSRFASLYAEKSGEPMLSGPPDWVDRTELRLVICQGDAALERVAKELERTRSGASAGDVAILTLAGRDRSELVRRDVVGRHSVVPADHDEAEDQVVADTFLRFKGLERPIVLITEIDPSAYRYDVRMHIALTRASVQAIVICNEEAVRQDPRLGLLAAS